MRKLFITLTVALLIIPTITFAQEGNAEALRAALNAKLAPSIEAPQAKSAQPQVARVPITYQYGAIFNYQATNSWWWSGLVIRNSVNPNYLQVKFFDDYGVLRGQGTLYLGTFNEQAIYVVAWYVDEGYVPAVGSIYVYGTSYFSTVLFVGNGDGGFSEIEKDAMSF
jgi:hypothetical protein